MIWLSKVVFQNLNAEMKKRGIKKKEVAELLGINYKSFYNKLAGETPFLWPEVEKIHDAFFPDLEYDNIFARKK